MDFIPKTVCLFRFKVHSLTDSPLKVSQKAPHFASQPFKCLSCLVNERLSESLRYTNSLIYSRHLPSQGRRLLLCRNLPSLCLSFQPSLHRTHTKDTILDVRVEVGCALRRPQEMLIHIASFTMLLGLKAWGQWVSSYLTKILLGNVRLYSAIWLQ